jgi:hypothetical protein
MGVRNLPIYAWPKEKERLEEMRKGMQAALDRKVIMAEVIRALLAEHDKAMEAESA